MREDDPKERIAKIFDEARRKGRLPAHYYADEILSAIPRVVGSTMAKWFENILLTLFLIGLLILLSTVLGIRFR